MSGGFGLVDWQAGTGRGSADWWCAGTSPHFRKTLEAGFLLSRLYGRRHLVPRVSSSVLSSVDFLRWKKVEGEDHLRIIMIIIIITIIMRIMIT